MSLRSIAVLFAFVTGSFLIAQSQQPTPIPSSARLGPPVCIHRLLTVCP